MSNKQNIRKLQEELGFVGKDADGIRGPKTNAMILAAADQGRLTVIPPLTIIKPGDAASLPAGAMAGLTGVHDALKGVVLGAVVMSPVPFACIEGLRTKERQAQLVKAGASKTANSRHLTGHAVDLWPIDPTTGKRLPSDAAFPKGSAAARAASDRLWADLRLIAATMKAVAKERGVLIEWGGDWGWDAPHFQLNRTAYPA